MIQVKMKNTGELRWVTPNEAHGLVDSGDAILSSGKVYETREMRTEPEVVVAVSKTPAPKATKSHVQTSKTYKSKS